MKRGLPPLRHSVGRSLLGVVAISAWFAVLCLLSWGVWWSLPDPRPVDQVTQFSGAKALTVLRALDYPHPFSSYEHLEAQEYIYQQLAALLPGRESWLTIVRGSNRWTDLNVFIILDGAGGVKPNETRNTFLVNAHYDTQSLTPGAQDNGCGVVTALETLRVLVTSRGQPKVPAIFLFNYDEEGGFRGIKHFLSGPYGRTLGGFLNFDGREGYKSVVFRTTGSYLDRIYRDSALHPSGSAITDDIIHNAAVTDFYLLAGINGGYPLPGFDMGYIDEPQTYHTSQDCASHVTASTLQHQGDNVLAFVSAVLSQDSLPTPSLKNGSLLDRVVYFDLFGLSMVLYSRFSALFIHLLFLSIATVVTIVFARTHTVRYSASIVSSIILFLSMMLGICAGVGVSMVAEAANPHYYQGNLPLALGIVALANAVTVLGVMHLFETLRNYCGSGKLVPFTEPFLWQCVLNILVASLAISCVMTPFISGVYLLLPIAFSILLAVILRLALNRLAYHRFPLFGLPPGRKQYEVLLNESGPESPSNGSTRSMWLPLLTAILATTGSYVVLSNTIAGIGATTAFPEAGSWEPMLFATMVSIFVTLIIFALLPFALLDLGMTGFVLACIVLFALFVPACVLYPHNSSTHPIRIIVEENFKAAQFTSRVSYERDFVPMQQQLASLPYFKGGLSAECDSLQWTCTYPSTYAYPFDYGISSRVRGNGERLEVTLVAPVRILSAELAILGAPTNVTAKSGSGVNFPVVNGRASLEYTLQDRTTIIEFTWGPSASVQLVLQSDMSTAYSYSQAVGAIMCSSAHVMIDSYFSVFRGAPSLTYTLQKT